MLRVFTWLTTEHDWRLMAVAITICSLASFVAINLFQHARETSPRNRWTWLFTAGAACGVGLWATHLVAVLAYEPTTAAGFRLAWTAAALAVAVGVTAIGLAVAAAGTTAWNVPAGGAILGAGIVVMHNLGIAGLDVPGRVVWAMDLVGVSVVVAVTFAMAAIVGATRRETVLGTLVASVLLASGVIAHHFIAIGAAEVLTGPVLAEAAPPVAPPLLAICIAGGAAAILGMSLVALI